MNKTQKLKDIYALIKAGNIVAVSGKHANGYLWVSESRFNPRRQYINWQNFGSSANRMGLNNLRWIVNTIFESKSLNYMIVDSVYGQNPILED
jgi:hypothetical protein